MTLLAELIDAIADAEGKEPEELEIILEDHINTDAIQRLHEHESDAWTLQFEIPNHTVRITGDGTIHVGATQPATLD
jgi:hypothetical protein